MSEPSKSPVKTRKPPKARRDAARPGVEAAERAHDAAVLVEAGEVKPFWETKRLSQMSAEEWDSLCDGCGQCCLNKVEDEDSGRVFLTRLSCGLLDLGTCRCKDYENRFARMPDCLSVDLKAVKTLKWLPESCAYRRLHERRGLAWWHPLISGDPETVHQAGVSVRGWARSEKGVAADQIERFIIGEAT